MPDKDIKSFESVLNWKCTDNSCWIVNIHFRFSTQMFCKEGKQIKKLKGKTRSGIDECSGDLRSQICFWGFHFLLNYTTISQTVFLAHLDQVETFCGNRSKYDSSQALYNNWKDADNMVRTSKSCFIQFGLCMEALIN